MSIDQPNEGRDLFDFPEADGVEDFGFAAPQEPEVEVAAEAPAPAPTAAASRPLPGEVLEIDPIPNPPLPAGIDDLEADLFDFDAAMSAAEPAPAEPAVSAAFHRERVLAYLDGFKTLLLDLRTKVDEIATASVLTAGGAIERADARLETALARVDAMVEEESRTR